MYVCMYVCMYVHIYVYIIDQYILQYGEIFQDLKYNAQCMLSHIEDEMFSSCGFSFMLFTFLSFLRGWRGTVS